MTKCINDINIQPSPMLIIITPNWLRVDRATIFFISDSAKADVLAMIIVPIPVIITKSETANLSMCSVCRIST